MDLEKNVLHAVTGCGVSAVDLCDASNGCGMVGKMAYLPSEILPLSQCIQYTEGFRPDGIKAYSILDTHWITRMTMGAIIGKGPNKADPHRHHDLYQWYLRNAWHKVFVQSW